MNRSYNNNPKSNRFFVSIVLILLVLFNSSWYCMGNDDNTTNITNNGTITTTTTNTTNDNNNSIYDTILSNYSDKFYRAPDEKRINDTYIIVFNRTTIVETNISNIITTIQQESNPNSINVSSILEGIASIRINLNERFGNGTTSDERRINILLPLLKNKFISLIEEVREEEGKNRT